MGKAGRRDGSGNGFEEWGGYMSAKKQKLEHQLDKKRTYEHLLDEEKTSDIFKGVSIFVNGYTKPTAEELKRLMVLHGGLYQHYYNRSKTTHIIATNLPDSKIRELKDEKIVKPDWIIDSINAGQLLPYSKYLLYLPKMTKGQTELQFSLLKNNASEGKHVKESTELNNGNNKNLEEETRNESNSISLTEFPDQSKGSLQKDVTSIVSIASATSSTAPNISAGPNNCKPDVHTAKDPSFISEFYSHSRLHHIATARSEFRDYVHHLASLSDGTFPKRDELKKLRGPKGDTAGDKAMKIAKSGLKQNRVIMHIDMDCFFVSVGLRKRPDLIGKPVAVTHSKTGRGRHQPGSDLAYEQQFWRSKSKYGVPKSTPPVDEQDSPSTEGASMIGNNKQIESETNEEDTFSMSEVASCSYEARQAGVRNGMLVGQALKLCPDLKFIPYDFDGYTQVSRTLYDTVASYTLDIEAVSCDEMYVDCTEVLSDTGLNPAEFASHLRQQIKEKTGCNASAGMGSNMLLARLATKVAKPNGQFYLPPEQVAEFIGTHKVTELPGVGYAMSAKMEAMNIVTCEDLQRVSLSTLQKEFGPKTAQTLYDHCRGVDDRILKVEHERKSVSAEVNYGIRFQEMKDATDFIMELSKEVQQRLKHIRRVGRTITLKVKVRRKDAPLETAKFLGHGACDNVTRSVKLYLPTCDYCLISKECITLLQNMKVEPQELRGVGIQVTHLEQADGIRSGPRQATLDFITKSAASPKRLEISEQGKSGTLAPNSEHSLTADDVLAVPGPSKEITPKNNNNSLNSFLPSPSQIDQDILAELPEEMRKEIEDEYAKNQLKSNMSSSSGVTAVKEKEQSGPVIDLPNVSQLDMSVLEELPEDVRKEILEAYTSRASNPSSATSSPAKVRVDSSTRAKVKPSPRKGCKKASPLKAKSPLKNQRTIVDLFAKKSNSSPAESKPNLSKSKLPKATICGMHTLDDVKVLLSEWVESSNVPVEEDVRMFQNYITDLLGERNLEKLDLIIKHFYRLVKAKNQSKWQETYFTMIEGIQSHMKFMYGSILKVHMQF